ncbi:MAG: hypothetical protein ABI641_13395, partial [Caldimonas sp.]
PTLGLEQVAMKEGRYAMLGQSDPARSKQLMKGAQRDADARWQLYEQMAGVHRVVSEEGDPAAAGAESAAAPQPPAAPAGGMPIAPSSQESAS